MSHIEKVQALKQEISRLKKARESDFTRHIDIANLVNARDKLRVLELEAQMTISDNQQRLP